MTAVLLAQLAVLMARVLECADPLLLSMGSTVGVLGVVQFLGLVRWPFLRPYVARVLGTRGDVAVTLPRTSCSTAVTPGKLRPAYDLAMATKQHKTYCTPCGATTNHITSYGSPDGSSGASVISVRCAEHCDLHP